MRQRRRRMLAMAVRVTCGSCERIRIENSPSFHIQRRYPAQTLGCNQIIENFPIADVNFYSIVSENWQGQLIITHLYYFPAAW